MTVKRVALFDEVMDISLRHAVSLAVEEVPVEHSKGRTLARDALAAVDVPPFSRAMMDGFAVRSKDCTQPGARLRVTGSVAAGTHTTDSVGSGQAIRIMTGAPIPTGADAVVRFEWCNATDNDVHVLRSVVSGESVQPQGEDGKAGTVVAPAGRCLTGAILAVLQAFGVSTVDVRARPAVALVITGSELVQSPAATLQPGQIYGSNHIMLKTALTEDGADVTSITFVNDDPARLREAVTIAARSANYVLTTGGVSAGDHDYMPRILQELGGSVAVEKVLMRPGSPLVIARLEEATVFAMSGNPAACFAQYSSFVRPTIRKSLGQHCGAFPSSGLLTHDISLKSIKHVRVLRARADIVDGVVQVDVRLAQSPGVISSFAQANCLVRLDEDEYPAGSVVPLQWLGMPY